MLQPNFLILDEPTNDLDIVTLGILEEYLRDFKGCVIIVSHDRFFLDSIVDHIFVMEGNGVIKDFPGNYSDWRKWREENIKNEVSAQRDERVAESNISKKTKPTASRPAKLSFKERQELEQLTSEMDKLNAGINEMESKFNSGEVLDDAAGMYQEYSAMKSRLDEVELHWLELSERE